MLGYWKNGLWETGVLDKWSAKGGMLKLKADISL